MTAGLLRRLFSMEFLVGDGHARLDEASNGLAHLLIDQGAGVGMRLTLCWKHGTRKALKKAG